MQVSRLSCLFWFLVLLLVCFLGCLARFRTWLEEECHTSITKSIRSRAGIPSKGKPSSSEMTSDSVELCETEVRFLDIQLWEQMYDCRNTQHALRGRFRIFKISCKVRILEQSQSAFLCSISNMTRLLIIARVVDIRYQTSQASVTSFCPFVTSRASLSTDHRMSGLPMRAKYRHFRTICEQTFDNSPTDFISSSLKWWSSMHGVDTLYNG